MSGLLSAPPPVSGPAVRAEPIAPSTQAPRVALAARPETARAARPPEGAAPGLNLRFEDREGRPVGPPPAFQTTLLQALHEGALDPPAPRAGEGGAGFGAPPAEARPGLVDRKV